MTPNNLFEKGDYCLYCVDINSNFPSKFHPCFVLQHQSNHNCGIVIKICETSEEKVVNFDNLIFIKKFDKNQIELMYNSKVEKGGSYNVTDINGIRLVASFYFDDEISKSMAESDAKNYIERNNVRKYRIFIGDPSHYGHCEFEEFIIKTPASKEQLLMMINAIPEYFNGYQFFITRDNETKSSIKKLFNDCEDDILPEEFRKLLIEKIKDFPNDFGEKYWEDDNYHISLHEMEILIINVLNYIAEKMNFPTISIDKEIVQDLNVQTGYGLF